MNNDRIDELLALAALGELSAAEEAELDRALEADASLGDELDADQEAAAFMQSDAAELPPPGQRANVLGAIAGTAQEPVEVSTQPTTFEAADAAASTPADRAEVASLDTARRRRSTRWQPLIAAAAVVGLIVGGASLVNRGDDAPSFADITQSSDATTRTLKGPLDGELRVVFSPSADAFVLDGVGVAEVANDETYQLWLVDDSGATSVGIFQPDDEGRVMKTYEGQNPSGFVVGVTVEPAGGSEQPTLPIVASA